MYNSGSGGRKAVSGVMMFASARSSFVARRVASFRRSAVGSAVWLCSPLQNSAALRHGVNLALCDVRPHSKT